MARAANPRVTVGGALAGAGRMIRTLTPENLTDAVALELAALRGERSQGEVAAAIEWQQSKLSRIETGAQAITVPELAELAEYYGTQGSEVLRKAQRRLFKGGRNRIR